MKVRSSRARWIGGLLASAMLMTPAAAQAQDNWSCRASALKAPILGEPWVANPGYTNCTEDQAGVPQNGVTVPGLAKVYIFNAQTGTDSNPFTDDTTRGAYAIASVAYAQVTLPGFNIKVWTIESHAGSKCTGFEQSDLGGYSTIAAVSINNTFIPVAAPNNSIPLLGLGTLHLNYGQKTENEVITRAVWLDLAGDDNDVIISEARAGRTPGNCGAPA